MLIFELVALLAPEEVSIDPFELLKTMGSFIFNAYCGPTGFAGAKAAYFQALYYSQSTVSESKKKNKGMKKVAKAWA